MKVNVESWHQVSKEQEAIIKWLSPLVDRFVPEATITAMDPKDDHRVFVNCTHLAGDKFINPNLAAFNKLICYIQRVFREKGSKMVFRIQEDEAGAYCMFNIYLPNSSTVATFYKVHAGRHVFTFLNPDKAAEAERLLRNYGPEIKELYDSSVRYASTYIGKYYSPCGFEWEDEYGALHCVDNWKTLLELDQKYDVVEITANGETVYRHDSIFP